MKFIRTKKSLIYHVSDVPNPMGPIHGLCLQLVVTSIINLGISDKKNLGRSDLILANVIIKLGHINGQPTVLNPSSWESICLVQNTSS